MSPRAGGHSFSRRAGDGTGWASLSPQRQDKLDTFEGSGDDYDGDDRLRPRMITFQSSSEAQTNISGEGSSTFAQQLFESRQPLDDIGWLSKDAPAHGCTDANKRSDASVGGVEVKAKTYQDQEDDEGGTTRATNQSRIGLKCNTPNGGQVPTPRGQQASSRSSGDKPESGDDVEYHMKLSTSMALHRSFILNIIYYVPYCAS